MRQAAGGADRFDGEPVFQSSQMIPDPHASAEHNGHDGNVQEVNEIRMQELAHGRRPATDPHILPARRIPCKTQCLLWRSIYEVETGAICELNGLARVMGQDEARCEEGRFISPPSFPAIVGPLPGLRTEFAAAHDFCADSLSPHAEYCFVHARWTVGAMNAVDDPAIELAEKSPGLTDRLFERHVIAGGISVTEFFKSNGTNASLNNYQAA
ncbi:hypothetical protein GA0061084_0993 [Arthrobacter sp. NIO-1057]|nr:hypothetical protein GA0061084_0993 [Arthrobacter sp. NIO-1057]